MNIAHFSVFLKRIKILKFLKDDCKQFNFEEVDIYGKKPFDYLSQYELSTEEFLN